MAADRIMTIGVDIGGTKIASGVVAEDGSLVAEAQRRTPARDPQAIEVVVAECVAELADGHPVGAVGVAAAGFVSSDRSSVIFAPNLAWRDRPLRRALEGLIGRPVVVENDANAAAWAEYRFGAGRGHRDVVMLTLGTGVGGGIVVGGRLVRGTYGFAGEIGHVRAVPGGHPCGCGNAGCWEQYISGNALVREARRRAVADPAWAPGLLERAGGFPGGITGPLLTEVGQTGEPAVVGLLAEVGGLVGAFCASLVAVLDPGVLVIGGGVSTAGDLLLEPAREAFGRTLSARGHRPAVELRRAELGNEAGMVGAADLARTEG
jgi:glucokinase